MHFVYLNVTKQLICYALRLKLVDVDAVSDLMMRIQVPHYFHRKPRSLHDMAKWKATELKQGL